MISPSPCAIFITSNFRIRACKLINSKSACNKPRWKSNISCYRGKFEEADNLMGSESHTHELTIQCKICTSLSEREFRMIFERSLDGLTAGAGLTAEAGSHLRVHLQVKNKRLCSYSIRFSDLNVVDRYWHHMHTNSTEIRRSLLRIRENHHINNRVEYVIYIIIKTEYW
jgi:hypothetical protein